MAGKLAAALVLAATAIPVMVIAADSRSRLRTAPSRGELAGTGSSGTLADWCWRAAHLRALPSKGLGGAAHTRRYWPNL